MYLRWRKAQSAHWNWSIEYLGDQWGFIIDDNSIKVPAGWLIETAGFKGKRFGDAGVHNRQALVLVNHGNASGQEIFELAKRIQSKIKIDFGVKLEIEVNVY